MTFLKALLLETKPAWVSAAEGGVATCRRVSFKGVDKLMFLASRSYGDDQGLLHGCGLAACSGPRRLALLSGCQFGVAQRLMAALVATTAWDN